MYHPHWIDKSGVVHIGNFTGPFTACGYNNHRCEWRDNVKVPATCLECLNYMTRRQA